MHFRGYPSHFFIVMVLLSTLVLSQPLIHLNASASGYLNYIPITLTNQQSTATATPFQDSFSFNPSKYTPYEASDLGNMRLFAVHSGSSFTNELYAWIESYSGSTTPNTATSVTVWVNLPNGIGAGSSITIYLVFEPTSVDFDGLYLGEAPQLSPSYGQFDNGAFIFPEYNNGTNLFPLSQTGTGGSAPLPTVTAPSPYTHAITGSVNGGGAQATSWTTTGETASPLPSSYVAQEYVYLTGTSPLSDLMANVKSISSGQFYVFRFDARAGSYDLIGAYPTGGTVTSILAQSSSGSSTSVWYQMSAVDNGDKLSLYKSTSFSLNSFGTLEVGPISGMGYSGGGVAVTTDGASSTEYWTMIIVRAYPPNGIMPTATFGSVMIAVPAYPFDYSYVSPTASVESPSIVLQSTITPPYLPIILSNPESAPTVKGLQVMLNVDFRSYESYLISDAGNIRFFNSSSQSASSELPAWLEYYSGNTTVAANTATSSAIWVSLKGTVINAQSSLTIYMVFENGLDFDGTYFGEAPQLSPIYGKYDNGATVFEYYQVAPSSTSGWTIQGSAGQTSSGPAGSHFGSSDVYYANSAKGDYMFTQVPNLGTNEIMSFWTYTTGLGNMFFLADSAGKGQMARLDSRGGGNWAGLASTASWTSWNAPSSGLDKSVNTWYKYDIVLNSSLAKLYIGASTNNLATMGTLANNLSITNYGNYVGLVGDALGSSYVTYWNGFILRYYPPNGVLPNASFGGVVLSGIATTVSPEKNAASIGVTAGLTFYESAIASTICSSPSTDTSFAAPTVAVASSFTVPNGTSVCLWSPQYTTATTIFAGTWLLNLWALSVGSTGSLSVSIYTINSSGYIESTIVSNAPTSTIGTSPSKVQTAMTGAQGSVAANGYVEVDLRASSTGPTSYTIYWGSNSQPSNFESPIIFDNILAVNNTSGSPMQLSMSVASTTGSARLANFTLSIGPPAVSEISIGSLITTTQYSGPTVTIPSSSILYISLNSNASFPGQSTVVISMKSQNYVGGPYAQYTILITIG